MGGGGGYHYLCATNFVTYLQRLTHSKVLIMMNILLLPQLSNRHTTKLLVELENGPTVWLDYSSSQAVCSKS